MEAQASSTQPQPSSSEGTTRPQRHRRPRGRGNSANASTSVGHASVDSNARLRDSHHTVNADTSNSNAGPRNNASKRGRGRGGRPDQARTVNGRKFGGQLTTSASSNSSSNVHLQADAAVFVPGQQHIHQVPPVSAKLPSKVPHYLKRRLSKSQAPDIATRTHEDIDSGYYECPICTSEVRRNSKVWSCHTCWTVFHLACIKKWSSNQGSSAAQQEIQSADTPTVRQWRCPGCNLPKDEMPKMYLCWCGKETDPRPLAGLPPHSCGNTCGRERARRCPHPCQLTCHAGPCPPCTHMGPTQTCFCGKHDATKRCSETDYSSGWSCGQICAKVMPCGEHSCSRPCHEGACGECEVQVLARCYCGKVEKDIRCASRGSEEKSTRTYDSKSTEPETTTQPLAESWTGVFDCGSTCDRSFDCGVHHCARDCHAQQAEATHCPNSPDVVAHCPCGKTALTVLSDSPRTSCSDPIPHCKQVCDKKLSCGHSHEEICHSGACSSCMKMVDIHCRCGRTTSKSVCHQGREELPQCPRVCRMLLNCGRHSCEERCCSGERKAAERLSSKRKSRPLNSMPRTTDDGFEAEHICTRQCGRLLKCGTHFCQDLCHKGPCGTCIEATFEEISCHCGMTVLQPPLPCGTKAPPCRFLCNRPKACGHPQVAHNCHQDDEACPKCPFLIEKRCMCSKKTLKNQQCWLQDVRCGEICGKTLKCGSHFCRKPCHRAGECEDARGQPCLQVCGKLKKSCGHPDVEYTCHAPFSCKEDKLCQSKIYITCPCQAQKQEMKCGASKTGDGNATKALPCNDDCARLERNRKLALALNIDQSTHVDGGDHIPYSAETLNLFSENMKWAQDQEREFRVFSTSKDEKRLRFKPMPPHQRAFIHALAEDFGLDSESEDPEPHRHVVLFKTPRFVSAPHKTLAEASRIRQSQKSITENMNMSDNETSKKAKSRAVVNEPYNSFVISNPRFGLTIEELRAVVVELVYPSIPVTFDIEFLPSDEVVLKAMSRPLPNQDLQQLLKNLKTPLAAATSSKGYGTVQLCTTDSSLNVIQRESDGQMGDGWSKVAAKKAAPKMAISNSVLGNDNSFSALGGNKVTFAKKKLEKIRPKKEVVVDDWEAAEIEEEMKERATSGGSGDEGEDASSAQLDHSQLESDVGTDLGAGSDGKKDGLVAQLSSDPATVVSESQGWATQVADIGHELEHHI